MTHPTPIPPPADAELRTSRPTPRPPNPDDPRIGIAANAIGWELWRHNREVTYRGDGNAQITVTATEVAVDRAVPGGGHGIVGMRERATLLGGTLEVDRDRHRFRLRARIPRTGAASS